MGMHAKYGDRVHTSKKRKWNDIPVFHNEQLCQICQMQILGIITIYVKSETEQKQKLLSWRWVDEMSIMIQAHTHTHT